jgi:D-serine dehydratase
VSALNDQHAYLRLDAGAGEAEDAAQPTELQLGDRICLGVSHPCTTFDKWRWMPLVDDDANVVDAITTWF